MKSSQEEDKQQLLPEQLKPTPSSLYLSIDDYRLPNDEWQNKWKSTRSQSQTSYHEQGLRQLKRHVTDSKEQVEIISNQEEKIRQQVRSERNVGKSIIYSPNVKESHHYPRGISIVDQNLEIYQPIEISSFFAWFLLIFSSISNAIVPCWMTVDINCQGLTRSAWRIFTTSILLIPFVLYEQRNIKSVGERFINLLNRQNLQKHFIYSMNYSVWVLFGTLALKMTARSHSFSLLRLKFFFITIRKFLRKEDYYESEMGGVLLVMIGVMMIFWDSYSLPEVENPLAFYLSYSPLRRFCGDLLAILGSLAILYFQSNYEMPKSPRFSNLLIYNVCLTINLIIFGYFFGGNEFTFHPVRGVFGLFTQQNFVNVFYVSIMLGLNLIISNLLVDKIFSEFIRNVSSCFEPVITISIYHIFAIEVLTPGMTCLGLAFFVPGMMLIVGGQNYLKKQEIKIDFLIYKEEEKHFFEFAKQSYQSKIRADQSEKSSQSLEQGSDEESHSSQTSSARKQKYE